MKVPGLIIGDPITSSYFYSTFPYGLNNPCQPITMEYMRDNIAYLFMMWTLGQGLNPSFILEYEYIYPYAKSSDAKLALPLIMS